MRKFKFVLMFAVLMFIIYSKDVSADYTIKNDGTAKDNPFEDSGLPTSFNDCQYYDCAIPYKLVPNDIGGWCTDVVGGPSAYKAMSEDRKTTCRMGGYINHEGDMSWAESRGGTKGYEPDTGCTIITDANGTQYYVTAIQGFFYNNETAGGSEGFPGWSSANRGQIFDVILTDGTVIHFAVGDANSNAHTNGGNGSSDGEPSSDGTWYFADMKIATYKNLYAGSAGNQIEIWGQSGCTSKFMEKYGITYSDDTGVKIAYYRLYNKKVSDAPKPVSNETKALSYNLGSVNIVSSGQSDQGNVLGTTVSGGIYAETKFVANKTMNEDRIQFPELYDGDLLDDDIYEIENWKLDLEHKNEDSLLIKGGRWLSMLCGLIFILWAVFIYLAYWFDRINNFIELNLLKIVTFGKLTISPDESECTFSIKELGKGETRTINNKKLIPVCLLSISFGTFIVSGQMFSLLQKFVNMVLSIIS